MAHTCPVECRAWSDVSVSPGLLVGRTTQCLEPRTSPPGRGCQCRSRAAGCCGDALPASSCPSCNKPQPPAPAAQRLPPSSPPAPAPPPRHVWSRHRCGEVPGEGALWYRPTSGSRAPAAPAAPSRRATGATSTRRAGAASSTARAVRAAGPWHPADQETQLTSPGL